MFYEYLSYPDPRCLKITEKVSFNSYVYKKKSLKFQKWSNLASFWKTEACSQTVVPDKLILNGQKLVEMPKIQISNETFLVIFKQYVPTLDGTFSLFYCMWNNIFQCNKNGHLHRLFIHMSGFIKLSGFLFLSKLVVKVAWIFFCFTLGHPARAGHLNLR